MLWILRPLDSGSHPWRPFYDKMFGVVVRAKTELNAREVAAANSEDEGGNVWRNEKLTSCIQLNPDAEDGVILKDVYNG